MKSSEAIKTAQGEIGYTESPANSNKTKYGEWYGVNGKAWCLIFQQWVFRGTSLLLKTASCSQLLTWFKNNGRFFSTPQVGDLVFFNFHTPDKPADHVGIVESIKPNGTIVTIEGNTSFGSKGSQDNGGCVARRERKDKIVGYGRPKYDNSSVPKTSQRQLVKEGSKGADVVYLKQRLTSMGFGNLSLENDVFTKGVGDAVQFFQLSNGLTADRICGPQTWNAIDRQ